MATDTRKMSLARSADSIYDVNPFGFGAQTDFYATQHLLQNRSDRHTLKLKPIDNDIWKRPPPDFRIQVYEPDPPPRNSRSSMQPWRWGPNEKIKRSSLTKSSDSIFPKVLQHRRPPSPKIVSSGFNIPGPFEAKILFVQEGQFQAGKYRSPKPHDHRGYLPIKSLGLPEFDTASEHDPYGIKFQTERLNTIYHMKPPPPRDLTGRQMDKPMSARPQWDPKLILPKETWPNKSHQTTRHRRLNRSVHSALMERVEAKINAQWAKERLDAELAKVEDNEKRKIGAL